MDAFFIDPKVERHPPEEIRFVDLRAAPHTDGRRIRIGLELTPFLKRPLIELTLTGPKGESCGTTSIVEPVGWKLELTLHIRIPEPLPGKYTLTALLSYPELGETDHRQIQLEVPPLGES